VEKPCALGESIPEEKHESKLRLEIPESRSVEGDLDRRIQNKTRGTRSWILGEVTLEEHGGQKLEIFEARRTKES
jgi:hypothetical protein